MTLVISNPVLFSLNDFVVINKMPMREFRGDKPCETMPNPYLDTIPESLPGDRIQEDAAMAAAKILAYAWTATNNRPEELRADVEEVCNVLRKWAKQFTEEVAKPQ